MTTNQNHHRYLYATGQFHQLRDKIIVKDLTIRNITGVDAWERSKKQTLILNAVVYFDVGPSGETDALGDTVSYASIAKKLQGYAEESQFRSIEALASALCFVCLDSFGLEGITINIQKPRALLHASSAGVELTRFRRHFPQLKKVPERSSVPDKDEVIEDLIFIHCLQVSCIIGVNPWEREEKQIVRVTLKLHVHLDESQVRNDQVPRRHNYRTIARSVMKLVEESDYKTVEALATSIAKLVIYVCHVPKVTVLVEKPSALIFAQTAAIEITRTRESFDSESHLPHGVVLPSKDTKATVFLGVGTNQGDRVANIDSALSLLEQRGVKIIDSSFLYKTAPMYVEDQPDFLNAVVRVETELAPEPLLDTLKAIEVELGRQLNGQRYGPRPIDLDILYYNDHEINSERLVIPHPRIAEREFVLRPLCDIAGHMEHPGLYRTCNQLLSLLQHSPERPKVVRVFPVGTELWDFSARTYIMGILNVTPDSFSDGGKFQQVESAVSHAKGMVENGVDIIDIGGQSTRPNAEEVSEAEEINRIIPVIKALRSAGITTPISVDTFRANVAKEALNVGANLVNDVSGGTRDPNMLSVVKEARVPVCLMHMRGNSKTMMKLTDYGGNLIGSLRKELGQIVSGAFIASIRRWHVIVDPGVGFAKSGDQNYEILRRLSDLLPPSSELYGLPILVGVSRKGFIGQTLGEDDPAKRDFGTAAACSAAISGGAAILRVHDVKSMRDVVLVADQCFKSQ